MFGMNSAMNRFGKYLTILVVLVSFVGLASATPTSANIVNAMKSLCAVARTFLSFGAMLLVILAAAVYAIGQIVGAETRARASVWATAMITGALIGIVIYIVVPPLLSTMMGSNISC